MATKALGDAHVHEPRNYKLQISLLTFGSIHFNLRERSVRLSFLTTDPADISCINRVGMVILTKKLLQLNDLYMNVDWTASTRTTRFAQCIRAHRNALSSKSRRNDRQVVSAEIPKSWKCSCQYA